MYFTPRPPLSSLKKMCCIRGVGPWQPGWNVNHAPGWQIGGKLAFHLNYRLDRGVLCSLLLRAEELSQGIFLLHF